MLLCITLSTVGRAEPPLRGIPIPELGQWGLIQPNSGPRPDEGPQAAYLPTLPLLLSWLAGLEVPKSWNPGFHGLRQPISVLK